MKYDVIECKLNNFLWQGLKTEGESKMLSKNRKKEKVPGVSATLAGSLIMYKVLTTLTPERRQCHFVAYE